MAAKKPLNIGMIGYGFMGRAHSNALQAGQPLLRPRVPPGPQGRLRPRARRSARRSPRSGATSRSRPTGGSSSSARTSTRSTSARPNNTHAEIAIAAAAGGQDDPVREAAGDGPGRGRRRWSRPSRRPGVPNIVWYNYRRVPAVTLAKQLIDEGRLGRIFHYRANFLQDWTISADLPQGGAGLWRLDAAAAGSGVTGDLLAHCIDTALWLNGGDHQRHRDDRDVHQGAQAQPDRQGREGRHRRRLRVPLPLRERLARPRSSRPATPAATRRSTPSRSTARTPRSTGTCTTCTGSSTSTTATRAIAPRLAVDPRHRRRPSLHEELVGAGPPDRLRAHLRPPGGRLPRGPGRRQARRARPSATRSRRRPSATPCSTRPRSASGRPSCRSERFRPEKEPERSWAGRHADLV